MTQIGKKPFFKGDKAERLAPWVQATLMRTGACLWVQVRILEPGVPVTSQPLLTAGALFSSMGSTPGWISPDLESQSGVTRG